MKSNFGFLERNPQFKSFAQACIEAERSIAVSPADRGHIHASRLGVSGEMALQRRCRLGCALPGQSF